MKKNIYWLVIVTCLPTTAVAGSIDLRIPPDENPQKNILTLVSCLQKQKITVTVNQDKLPAANIDLKNKQLQFLSHHQQKILPLANACLTIGTEVRQLHKNLIFPAAVQGNDQKILDEFRKIETISTRNFLQRNWKWLTFFSASGLIGYLSYRHFTKPHATGSLIP